MTTEEHLNRIKEKCLANLALAEKRTPGKWHVYGESNCADQFVMISETRSIDCFSKVNAAYIAACAGFAEAGWRSTIAAIEGLKTAIDVKNGVDFATAAAEAALLRIIAAWPEELL
jgi:hypothetical protein